MRRVTGSVDVPLTENGRNQARKLALYAKRAGVLVFAAPNQRSQDTAKRINPKFITAEWLRPWFLGQYEGKELSSARSAINDLMVKTPDKAPGASAHSGKEGESFDQARRRIIGGVQKQRASMGSKDVFLNISSGRVLQIIHSWAVKGRPEDQSVDSQEIARERGEFSKPGQLFKLEPGGLRQVHFSINGPGQYFAQHGETKWNSEGAGK